MAHVGNKRNAYTRLVGNPGGKRAFGKLGVGETLKQFVEKQTGKAGNGLIWLRTNRWWNVMNTVMNIGVRKIGEFFAYLRSL